MEGKGERRSRGERRGKEGRSNSSPQVRMSQKRRTLKSSYITIHIAKAQAALSTFTGVTTLCAGAFKPVMRITINVCTTLPTH